MSCRSDGQRFTSLIPFPRRKPSTGAPLQVRAKPAACRRLFASEKHLFRQSMPRACSEPGWRAWPRSPQGDKKSSTHRCDGSLVSHFHLSRSVRRSATPPPCQGRQLTLGSNSSVRPQLNAARLAQMFSFTSACTYLQMLMVKARCPLRATQDHWQ